MAKPICRSAQLSSDKSKCKEWGSSDPHSFVQGYGTDVNALCQHELKSANPRGNLRNLLYNYKFKCLRYGCKTAILPKNSVDSALRSLRFDATIVV